MRPQGFGQVGAGLEDLGWNDMGFEPPKPAVAPALDSDHDAFGEVIPAHPHNLAGLTPVDSPVHDQQAEIAGRLSAFSPEDAGEEIDETAELYDAEDADETAGVQVEEQVVETAAPPPLAVEPKPVAFAKPEPSSVRPRRQPRAAPGSKAKAAFTLRLDAQRHLKLRLACAVNGSSAQNLVTQALDAFLATMPELDALADKAKRKG